jgi:arabinan endo-1,5-alpha-L-arabinosidase
MSRARRLIGVTVTAAGAAVLILAVVARSAPKDAAGATSVASSADPPPAVSASTAHTHPTQTPDAPGIQIVTSDQLDLPDPFLLPVAGTYYLYMSTAFNDPTNSNIPEMVGTPGHWSGVSDALPVMPAWARPASQGGKSWDPYVVHLGDRYLMYYAPTVYDATPVMHCIGVASARTPAGPFTAVSTQPLICQYALGGDIDSQLFVDPNGPRGPEHPNYLIWKSDNNNMKGTGPTTIWSAPLSDDGLRIVGPAAAIFTADELWELPVLEAPQMVRSPTGQDWLFFSAGTGFQYARYAMGVAKCSGPLGPCTTFGSTPFISSNAQGQGPGEETVFVASDGSTWLLYSPWYAGILSALLRPVEAARVGWSASGPYVAEAGAFPSPG